VRTRAQVFMAFNTSQGLISTLTTDKTLAFATLGVLYGVFTCTTIVAPKLVDVMGPRLAITLGAVPYVLFVFANILPVWGTLLPASAAVGFGAGLLWTGQGIYLSRCAVREAALKGEPVDIVTSRMNGIFWPLFQFNAAIGLTLASVILGLANGNVTTIKLMFAGFGAVGLLGVVILFSLKNAPPMAAGEAGSDKAAGVAAADPAASVNDDDGESGGSGGAGGAAKSGVALTDTLRLIYSSSAMRLLLPAIFYNGASIGFFTGTFPLIYQDPPAPKDGSAVTLALLPSAMVGYQAASFYLLNSGFSFAFGKWVVPRFGKRPLFLVTLATKLAFFTLIIALQLGWLHVAHQSAAAYALVFGLAAAFAMGDSVLESQLPAIIQSPSFFPVERERDAANAVLRMLMSLGFCTQFALGVYLECPAGGGAPGCGLQAAVLLPLMLVALACVAYCDRFVRSIDGGAAGKPPPEYAAVPGAED
jgi:MFS family permease